MNKQKAIAKTLEMAGAAKAEEAKKMVWCLPQSSVPMIVYLSGPMTGLPNNNKEAFNKYAVYYRSQGFNIKNPAEFPENNTQSYNDWLKRDIEILMTECNAIMMMPGWEASNGAKVEKHVAESLGYQILDACEIIDGAGYIKQPETICQIADRLTSEDRQKVYGPPSEDFTRQATMFSALGYRFESPNGELRSLEAKDIPMLMMSAKLSRLANCGFSHRDSIVDIAGYAKCLDQINSSK